MVTTISNRNHIATTPDHEFGVESFHNRQEWAPCARCRDIGPDRLFVRDVAQHEAAVTCRHYSVILQCRADALNNRVKFGVWGDLAERQHRAMLCEHPEITSWADLYAEQYAAQHKTKLAR